LQAIRAEHDREWEDEGNGAIDRTGVDTEELSEEEEEDMEEEEYVEPDYAGHYWGGMEWDGGVEVINVSFVTNFYYYLNFTK
jgi:hypothetical protein